MKTKEIHSFKEKIDEIEVPTEKLDEIIAKTIKETEVKRPRKRKWLYSTGVVAVTASLLLFGSAAVSPAMASVVSNIPIIGSIFGQSGDPGLEQVSEQGLTNIVGESQRVGNTTITIDEVFYGDTRFTIGFSLASDEPVDESYLTSGPEFTIDGEFISNAGSYGETEITPTYRTGILEIDAFEEIPESFTLGLIFEGQDGKNWDFSFPITRQADAESIVVDHHEESEGIDLTIPDLKISPAGVLISFQALSEENDYLAASLEFNIVDENGNELVSHSGGSSGEIIDGLEYVTGNRLFDPIDDHVQELTITPHLVFPTAGGGVEIDEDGNETAIPFQSRQGEEIEFKSFTVPIQ